MIKKSKLFSRLKELEIEEFNDCNPISTNIETKLIPFCEDVLSRIPIYLPEYTLHDINHSYRILENIESLLPEEIELNIIEIQLLFYSIFLHDIGMSPSKEIFLELEKEIKKEIKNDLLLNDGEFKSDLQNYIRKLHPKTSKEIIDSIYKYVHIGIDFTYKGIVLKDYIGNIIINHGINPDKLLDDNKYPTNEIIEKKIVNIRFLSVLLRLGDLLDIGFRRTPSYLSDYIDIENDISKIKWEKSQALRGKIIKPYKIMFNFYSENTYLEREIKKYIKTVEYEINECNKILSTSSKQLKLSSNVDCQIRTNGTYLSTNTKVHLDFKNIIDILKGTNLYTNKKVFLRELIQNSYDAIMCKESFNNNSFSGNIEITFNSKTKEFTFKDNGIGIDKKIFENYVIKIGESFYNSDEFKNNYKKESAIGKFGIGIISCFMVSDTINIISIKENNYKETLEPINYEIFVNEELVIGYPITIKDIKDLYGDFNTIIKLKLNEDFAQNLTLNTLKKFIGEIISYCKYDIKLVVDEEIIELKQNTFLKSLDDFEKELTNNNILEKISIDDENIEGNIYIYTREKNNDYILPNPITKRGLISQNGLIISIGRIDFDISWINTIILCVNMKKTYLNLKASRDEINKDDIYYKVRNKILKTIINKTELNLVPFICTNFEWYQGIIEQYELDFLVKQRFLIKINLDSTLEYINLLELFKEKDIYLLNFPKVRIENLNKGIILNEKEIVNNYHVLAQILISNNINHKIEIYVKENGFHYTKITIFDNMENFKFSLPKNDYIMQYYESLNNSLILCEKSREEKLFFIDSLNNFRMNVKFNQSFELGRLINMNKNLSVTKLLINSIESSFQKAFLNKKELIFEEDNDRYYYNRTKKEDSKVSKFLEKIIDDKFIEDLNKYLLEKFLPSFKDINTTTYNNYFIKKGQIPKWYIKNE